MSKSIFAFIAVLVVMSCGCAVRRPPFAPHRTATEAHVKAASVEECLECHNRQNMSHNINRGDCLKCHRLETGK